MQTNPQPDAALPASQAPVARPDTVLQGMLAVLLELRDAVVAQNELIAQLTANQHLANTELRRIRNAYEATLEHYNRLAPLQERMMRHMEREIDEAEDADGWKRADNEDDDEASGEDWKKR